MSRLAASTLMSLPLCIFTNWTKPLRTALVNSGLKFPLAAEMGQGAVAGVGGTRMCDWWFTENAVLIDTAGRYTTQEGDVHEFDAMVAERYLEALGAEVVR